METIARTSESTSCAATRRVDTRRHGGRLGSSAEVFATLINVPLTNGIMGDAIGSVIRTSRQSRCAAWLTRRTLRPFAEVLPGGVLAVHVSRAIVATAMLLGSPPPYRVRVDALSTGSFRGEWVYAPGSEKSRRVILYVHGSAYAICSARTHRGLVARLAHLTGMPVFSVDYRLAPEHTFPAAADDVEAAYAWLQNIGYRPENITVAGDSAGGHLLLDLLAENVRHRRAQPRAMVLMSPLVDLTLELARRQERDTGPDPLISAVAAQRLVDHYTRGHPADLPRLAPALDRADDLPRTLIQVGGAEMLLGDARAAHRMISDAGGDSELQIWPGQMHVFQALPTMIPEAGPALAAAARFITECPEPGGKAAATNAATAHADTEHADTERYATT